jgi:organic radical activating enzyme
MVRAKIFEIFSSIQGEGKYAGVRQVFVRFFSCNMHCVWCDTPASIGDTSRHFKEMTLEELVGVVREQAQGCRSVSLTGGEPLLQADFIAGFAPALRKLGLDVHLETNGIFYEALELVVSDLAVIAMDIKLPSSTQTQPYWKEHKAFLKTAVRNSHVDCFIKAVISSDTNEEDIHQAVDLVAGIAPEMLFILQPNTYDLNDGVMAKCLAFQQICLARLPQTRILPQMHKFMKIP